MISHSTEEHRAAARDLFLPFAQPVDAAKVRRDARQHVTKSTRDLSRASPSMNSCLPLVTLLRPFGARETIWLASFLLLTARTINRLFLVTLGVTASLRANLAGDIQLTDLPTYSNVVVICRSCNRNPRICRRSPRAEKKISWRAGAGSPHEFGFLSSSLRIRFSGVAPRRRANPGKPPNSLSPCGAP